MIINRTKLPGVLLITPDRFGDDRGYLQELLTAQHLYLPKYAFYSTSKKGVVRGLHRQTDGISKLISVIKGSIYDVAFNPTTGEWVGYELSADNQQQLLVPGFYAHGFQALEDDTVYLNLIDGYYHPELEVCVQPEIVDWPIKEMILSDKDKNADKFHLK